MCFVVKDTDGVCKCVTVCVSVCFCVTFRMKSDTDDI